MHILLPLLPYTCKTIWMPRKFPCDVTECGSNVTFDCSMRHLKNISAVSDHIFPNATELNLTENAIPLISQDAFSKLFNLTVLDLRWVNRNKKVIIHKKAFMKLTNLQILRLSGIQLQNIPTHLPVSLQILELSENHIVSLDRQQLSAVENITKLWLPKNCFSDNPCDTSFKITDDAFENMTKLEHLDLALNNLTHVPKNLPSSLLKLNLETNRIEYISKDDFQGLHNLTHLLIQGNCPRCSNAPYPCVPCQNTTLRIDDHAFSDLTKLNTLNMGGNSLKYLSPFWFQNMTNLKTLLLPFNLLITAITGKQPWLKCLPKLEKLDLSFNYGLKSYPKTVNLSEDFVYLKSLVNLHLEAVVFKFIYAQSLKPLYQLKNLSSLNLGTNFIIQIAPDVFKNFSPLKLILLSENRLYPISVENAPHSNTQYYQKHNSISISPLTRRFPDYKVHRHVKEECYNAGNVLVLSRNNLFFISEEQFKGYKDIACLNLSHNGFSVALNGTEFSPLPNLTYLDLSFNKIDLAYNWAFKDLPKLEVLDISYNSHYFEAVGITHNLNFTLNLPVLRVLNMSYNNLNALTTKEIHSKSLSELQFQQNNLGELWRDKAYFNIFTHLTNLSVLDISYNNIKQIPQKMHKKFPQSLTQLIISHNLLPYFEWNMLKPFHKLQVLNLSHNSLSKLTFKSDNAPSLKVLDLSYNHIMKLEDRLLTVGAKLNTLYLNNNKLTIINQSSFASDLRSEMETLYIDNNPFQCTCDSLDFILWLERSTIKIPQLTTNVKCATPRMPKRPLLIYFDVQQCVNDIEAFNFYIVTSSFIFVFMFVTMAAHLLYWDAFYIFYLLKAKLKGYSPLHSTQNAYDAFVAYDTRDPYVSEWVMEKLVVKLEGEEQKSHPLCLEERDWFPGTPLLDNLSHSVRNSRKTLFVLTEDYVKSGMFKMTMYLAHQRLLEENVDVILVLMLEPVLQHSHFLRLRKRLCDKSVLVWPKTAAAQSWFWQNLKNIIKVDNECLYNKTYINYFTSK
uniref:TIR domain-containing protein n=1 Tax=Periophthalmus magnuspinnatus TaxID=409849 RepID=A0A3B3ZND0_9GOBI